MKLLAIGLALLLQELPVPTLSGRIVDDGGVLTATQEAELDARLERLERETSTQIVILTIPSLGDAPIEDYSLRVAEAWKIGQSGLDNGAIIVVAVQDRRVRIEVGYGLEAVIPDGLAGRIIRERIAPAFREGRYDRGLMAAVDGLELAARREYPEAPPRTPASDEPGAPDIVYLFALFVIGIIGNAAGSVVAAALGALLGWLFAGIVGVPLGAIAGLIAMAFVRGGGRGGWTYHPTRGGGFRGGFGRGGGFGGGGFRGGGGGFGGGGASGSW